MYEVVVVGAGPVRSVAATVLAKQGRQVLLVDKEFPRDKACGDAIGWSSITLLSDLGFSPESKLDFCRDKVGGAFSPNGAESAVAGLSHQSHGQAP